MKFSVVIPTHHRPKTLQLLLESLSNQTLNNNEFEVIIVHSPKDQGILICEEYKEKLNLTYTEIPNDPLNGRSASAKRNYGASIAKANWLAFIDDDCIANKNWLQHASLKTSDDIGGIEGNVNIPVPERQTLTYKGIKRLSNSGGYQTCNMLYRKEAFDKANGFDPNFPFYLEDTDLGWSVKESGNEIIFADDVIVSHPVPPSEPYRLITGAKRTEKLVYLFKKHPEAYKSSRMETFRLSYRVYLAFYLMLLVSLFTDSIPYDTEIMALLILATVSAHMIKMFWKCSFDSKEFFLTGVYTLIVPIISFVYLLKGIIIYKRIPPL